MNKLTLLILTSCVLLASCGKNNVDKGSGGGNTTKVVNAFANTVFVSDAAYTYALDLNAGGALKWKVAVAGDKAVIKNTLFIASATGTYAIDSVGGVKWKYPVLNLVHMATDGKDVFFSDGGDVFCTDTAGTLKWKWEKNGISNFFIQNGVIYVQNTWYAGPALFALDAATGNQVSVYNTKSANAYPSVILNGSSLIATNAYDFALAATSTNPYIESLSTSPFGRKWKWTMPAANGQRVYPYDIWGLGLNKNVLYFKGTSSKVNNKYSISLYALDTLSLKILWKSNDIPVNGSVLDYTNTAIQDNKVLFGSDSTFYAVNTADGSLSWKYGVKDQSDYLNPVITGDKIFVQSFKFLNVLNNSGQLLWHYDLGNPGQGAYYTPSSPVIVDNKGTVYSNQLPRE